MVTTAQCGRAPATSIPRNIRDNHTFTDLPVTVLTCAVWPQILGDHTETSRLVSVPAGTDGPRTAGDRTFQTFDDKTFENHCSGDLDGAATWRRIVKAIGELQAGLGEGTLLI